MARKKWKVEGEPTAEFLHLDKLSNRDAIIYIANKYRSLILANNFLSKNNDYDTIASELGISSGDLYMYFTHRLKINEISNPYDQQKYDAREWDNSKEKIEKKRMKRIALKEQVFYRSFHIWKVLAFYCEFYSYKKAKSVLRKLQQLTYGWKKKGWTPIIKKRLQEIFTPLFFSKDNYKYRGTIVCKILRREKKGVYKGELMDCGQKGDDHFDLEHHYTPECLIIPNKEDDIEAINNVLKKKKNPLIVGMRDNPMRNIVNTVLDVKMRA